MPDSAEGKPPAMRLVPKDKGDLEACDNLQMASDAELTPYLTELLECLQDINWPIAFPVSVRLSTMGVELVKPTLDILNSDDEVWKYWIVSHFLHQVRPAVLAPLRFKLNAMKSKPTRPEIEEEVFDAVCELLAERPDRRGS
ncbi:DUF5071 domain-containing protein [Natronospirillum operosum]|nr:DUF5071 domain-containing protein [Natronospirillum operosum]